MKNLLVLIESLRINETSSGIVSSTFVKLLYSLNFNIRIITPNNTNYPIEWLPDDIEIHYLNIPTRKKRFLDYIPKLRAISTYMTGFHSGFRKLIDEWKLQITHELKVNNYDYIYVLGSGTEFAPHFAISELVINVPVILNFHDPFPMHLYPIPYRAKKNLINRKLEKRTGKAIAKAYKISFPSQLLMEIMAKTFPTIKEKGFVIPHIGTELLNLPVSKNDSLINLDRGKINFLHAGSLLGPRNPAYLIHAIIDLGKSNPNLLKDVKFIFVGKIARELKHYAEKSLNNHIQFYDIRISYKKSLELIRGATCMLVIEAISDISPFMPGKLADIALYEKPIITLTPTNSEVNRLLGKNYPYHANLDNKNEIAKAIKRFILDFQNQKVNIKSIRELKEYVSVECNSLILKKNLV